MMSAQTDAAGRWPVGLVADGAHQAIHFIGDLIGDLIGVSGQRRRHRPAPGQDVGMERHGDHAPLLREHGGLQAVLAADVDTAVEG
jgi:hypothetical protein